MRQLISRFFIIPSLSVFALFLFYPFISKSKDRHEEKNTLLLQTPSVVLSLSFQLWHRLIHNELHPSHKDPATRLRFKKNVERMERVLKQANQRYLAMLQEQLPQNTETHWRFLFKRHTEWLSLLEEISSSILQGDLLSQEQQKRFLSVAQFLALPHFTQEALTSKQKELLFEAIEIFATSNEMYGYYYVKQQMLCASSYPSSDPLLVYSLRQQHFLRALQKQTKQTSLASYIYHNALLSKALFLIPKWCHRPVDKKETHQKSKKILLKTIDALKKSLEHQSKSFSSLWTSADRVSPKGPR